MSKTEIIMKIIPCKINSYVSFQIETKYRNGKFKLINARENSFPSNVISIKLDVYGCII